MEAASSSVEREQRIVEAIQEELPDIGPGHAIMSIKSAMQRSDLALAIERKLYATLGECALDVYDILRKINQGAIVVHGLEKKTSAI